MRPEELMKPRYKVIADYPGSGRSVGDIITDTHAEQKPYEWLKENAEKYPHLFKKLQWWHLREESQLPKYVGFKNEANAFNWVHPVVKWDELREGEPGYCTISFTNLEGLFEEMSMMIGGLTPATESEYNTFIESKNNKE